MIRKSTVLLLAVALCFGLVTWLWAAQGGAAKPKAERWKGPSLEERVDRQAQLVARRLELDEEQAQAIGKALLEKEKKVEKLRKQILRVEAEANEKVRGLLKLEQRDAYEEMRIMMKRGGPRGFGGRRNGPQQHARGFGPRRGGPGGPGGMPGGFHQGSRGFGPGHGGFGPQQGQRPPMGPGGQLPPGFGGFGPQ